MEDDNAAQKSISSWVDSEQLRNAQLLLSYASDTGITLPREIIENIIRVKHSSDSGRPPADPVEMETSFLQATEALAKAVSPVTVASLRASYDKQDDTSLRAYFRARVLRSPMLVSRSTLSVRRFRRWALWTLLLLLIAQIYWVVGSSVTDDVTTTLKQVATDRGQKELLEREVRAIDARREEQKVNKNAQAADNDANDAQLDSEIEKKLNEINIIEARLVGYDKSTTLNYEILNSWNAYWRWPVQFLNRIIGSFSKNSAANEKSELNLHQRLLKSLKTAQFAVNALQIYLLPILYGLLGAITYVLRTLAVQIRSLTYTPETDICLGLRMILGALSGLVIVWFIKEDSETMLPFVSLSQFAIAFIAGYSVELLFAAMDRIISAFSGNTKETG